MIIAQLQDLLAEQAEKAEADYQQSCYEAGLSDGEIFWSCPAEMEKSIAYHQGYIQALKNKIWEMQFGISPVDPECGF